jgi:Tol biopolymer transport system component
MCASGRRLTRHCRASQPTVSPDGKTIVSVRSILVNARRAGCEVGGGVEKLYTMAPDRGRQRRLSGGSGSNYSPSVSPDGRNILFTRRGEYNNDLDHGDLYVMNAHHDRVRRLTHGEADDDYPSFSGDGQNTVCQPRTLRPRRRSEHEVLRPPGIWVMKATGRSLRRLVRSGAAPDWAAAVPAAEEITQFDRRQAKNSGRGSERCERTALGPVGHVAVRHRR